MLKIQKRNGAGYLGLKFNCTQKVLTKPCSCRAKFGTLGFSCTEMKLVIITQWVSIVE